MLGLKRGDIIDVVAPSSGHPSVSADQVREFVKGLGYKPRISDNFQQKDADLFSANNDDIRLGQLLDALKAQDSEFIWMFRGGYGATRLLEKLDEHNFSYQKPKTIMGFSDITAIGLYFERKYGWNFIHGPMLAGYAAKSPNKKELELVKQIISGEWNEIKYELKPLNALASQNKTIKGKITGGNLSLLQCSLGTNWQINSEDKILFLEETGERGYALDRMLQHLKQAGVFSGIKALIIGDIQCTAEKNGRSLCNSALDRFIQGLDVPVFKSKDFGHGELNYPLIFNEDATLLLGEDPSLIFQKTGA